MPTRIVKVGTSAQAVTTRVVPGKRPGFTEPHEHVTLETPRLSETQRLRALSVRDHKDKPT